MLLVRDDCVTDMFDSANLLNMIDSTNLRKLKTSNFKFVKC